MDVKQKKRTQPGSLKQAEVEANLTTYEKKLEAQLSIPIETLWQDILTRPNWDVKKNSDGKSTFWYGFKGHLVVSTKSKHIVGRIMPCNLRNSSRLMFLGNFHDCRTLCIN